MKINNTKTHNNTVNLESIAYGRSQKITMGFSNVSTETITQIFNKEVKYSPESKRKHARVLGHTMDGVELNEDYGIGQRFSPQQNDFSMTSSDSAGHAYPESYYSILNDSNAVVSSAYDGDEFSDMSFSSDDEPQQVINSMYED